MKVVSARHLLDNDPDLLPVEELPRIFTYSQLQEEYPEEKPYVVDGLYRLGETFNIVGASKTGKSWFALQMALSIVAGRRWLSKETMKGDVLYIDNELQKETLSKRLRCVASAMRIPEQEIDKGFHVISLRGDSRNLNELLPLFKTIGHGRYQLIVMDALYRIIPQGVNENDNGQMKDVYNTIDGYAAMTGAAMSVIHHSPKGDTSQRSVVDLGAGAGSISRCPDAQLVVRQHELSDHAVLDGVVRSSAQPEAMSIRFEFPLWLVAEDVAPVNYDPKAKAQETRAKNAETKKRQEDELALNELLSRIENNKIVKTQLRDGLGWGAARFNRVLAFGEKEGALEVKNLRKRTKPKYGDKKRTEKASKKGRKNAYVIRKFLTLELARNSKNPIETGPIVDPEPDTQSTFL